MRGWMLSLGELCCGAAGAAFSDPLKLALSGLAAG
jgi:hypothetical protein